MGKIIKVAVLLTIHPLLIIAEFDWEISYETWLTCPREVNFGTWGREEKCPHGTYVQTLQLKVQPDQGPQIDDAALNGVRLVCVTFKKAGSIGASTKPVRNITSIVGPFGEWKKPIPCKTGLAVGFKLRAEYDQKGKDDTAANDMRLVCSSREGTVEQNESTGTGFGKWTKTQICIEGSAVCGIQTQMDLNAIDNTSINNVDLICCKLPHPVEFCDPEYSWELVFNESDFSVDAGDKTDSNETKTISFKIKMAHFYRQNVNWLFQDFYPAHHQFKIKITSPSHKKLRQKLKHATRIYRLKSYFSNTHSSSPPKYGTWK